MALAVNEGLLVLFTDWLTAALTTEISIATGERRIRECDSLHLETREFHVHENNYDCYHYG